MTIEQGALLGASASILAGFASTGSKYSENYTIHRTYSLTFIFGYRAASIVVCSEDLLVFEMPGI